MANQALISGDLSNAVEVYIWEVLSSGLESLERLKLASMLPKIIGKLREPHARAADYEARYLRLNSRKRTGNVDAPFS
ncbi:MAG: hypothetical protein NXY57DRAFT_969522 [Lentinula lateritia]|nr:MAG: hypothetical protein NXY57DRAFT_969522 [Lentinula lateritia]